VGSLDDLAAVLDARPGQVSALIVAISDLSREQLDRACEICGPRGITVRRMRFDLEEVRRHVAHAPTIVRFPGA
jgi:hypothetical protein